mmetsp:Transcript_26675/g.54994  ORF Transcript_26675/g.54994 Transcript_26675/m.54994 type:complete len:116 (-) Transcript_26675:67-414(-)
MTLSPSIRFSNTAEDHSPIVGIHPQMLNDPPQLELLDGMGILDGDHGEVAACVTEAHEAAREFAAFDALADAAFYSLVAGSGFYEFVARVGHGLLNARVAWLISVDGTVYQLDVG